MNLNSRATTSLASPSAPTGGTLLLNTEKSAEQLEQKMQSKEVKTGAAKEIQDLNKTIQEIKSGFQKISRDLAGFDGRRFLDKDRKPIQLRSKWEEHYKRFIDILAASNKNAAEAASFIKGFVELLMQVNDVRDIPDLRYEMQQSLKRLNIREKGALSTQHDFEDLAKNIVCFGAEMDVALEQAGFLVNDEELGKLQEQREKLNADLETLKKKTLSWGVSAFSLSAISAMSTVFTLSPFTAVGVILSVVVSMSPKAGREIFHDSQKMNELKESIDARDREISEFMEQLNHLKQYKKTFEEAKGQIGQLSDKINVIGNIWQSIRIDMVRVNEDLDAAIGEDVERITKFTFPKLVTTRALYDHLADLLLEYAKGSTGVTM